MPTLSTKQVTCLENIRLVTGNALEVPFTFAQLKAKYIEQGDNANDITIKSCLGKLYDFGLIFPFFYSITQLAVDTTVKPAGMSNTTWNILGYCKFMGGPVGAPNILAPIDLEVHSDTVGTNYSVGTCEHSMDDLAELGFLTVPFAKLKQAGIDWTP